MKNKILKFYEKALSSIFFAFLYIIVFVALFSIGGFIISRFPPFLKLIGLAIVGFSIYFLAYYPLVKYKKE